MRFSFLHQLAACVAGLTATCLPLPLRAAESAYESRSVAAYVTEAAQRFAIPEAWIYAVMRVESAGNPRAISSKGATGLMQIMPATWAYLRARYSLAEDIYDPRANILAGAAYLRELYDRYGAPGFLAAYNAGPPRYEAYLISGRPLPSETVAYLARLAPITGELVATAKVAQRLDPLAWTRASVFVADSRNAAVASEPKPENVVSTRAEPAPAGTHQPYPGLFVPLSGQHPQ